MQDLDQNANLSQDSTNSMTEVTSTTANKEIVFIDATVADKESLAAGVKTGTEVVILNSAQDGIAQITEVLAGRSDIASVHIVSHGGEANLQLGSTQVNSNNLEAYTNSLQQWANALTPDADILLYGCNVAGEEAGAAFVQQLSQLTGADVAASNDVTGSAALGGDWNLEVATGKIESPLAFQPGMMQAYTSVLAQPGNVIINEFSQGTSGAKEWVEIVVVTDNLDLQNHRLVDGNGSLDILLSGSGFASLKAGTVIVLYNGGDVDNNISPDLTYAPANGDYLLQISSLNNTGAFAVTRNAGWGSTAGAFSNTNNTDVPKLLDLSGNPIHTFPRNTTPGAGQSSAYLSNTAVGATIGSNWSANIAAMSATPGLGNGGDNSLWINRLRGIITLNNPSPAANELFGFSIASSGTSVLVGAPKANGDRGEAYRISIDGVLQQTFINPSNGTGELFGFSVATNGTDYLIGSPKWDDAVADVGRAYRFNATDIQPQVFNNSVDNDDSEFGSAVAILSDGTFVISAPEKGKGTATDNAGEVRLFNSGGVLGAIANPSQPFSQDERFGFSVAAAGSTILVGAPGYSLNDFGVGQAYRYDIAGTLLQTFTNPNPNGLDLFGFSVTSNSAGTRFLIGAPGDELGGTDAGVVYLFDTTTPTPTLLHTFINPNLTYRGFGSSVAFVGNDILVGAPGTFTFNNATFTLEPDRGAAYLFDGDGTAPAYNLQQTFNNPNTGNDGFGAALAAAGTNQVAIGAPYYDAGANTDAGIVYLFSLNNVNTPSTVSIIVTDATADESGSNTGTYRLERTDATGVLIVKLAIDSSSSASSADYTLVDSNGNVITFSNGIATVTLQAGQTFVDIALTPTDDIQAEADETLQLKLEPDAIYTLSPTQNTATVTILANDTVVINTNDSGEGSLRQAILNANAFAGTDTISFQIGTGLQTITPLSALPTITNAVIIDGTTQPGFSNTPIIQLSGSGTGTGLRITAGNSTVRGLIINRFQDGIELSGGGNNVIAGNFIGTNAAGNAVAGNSGWGVLTINGSSNNIIGGTTAETRNIISGNQFGVVVFGSGNQIQGNYIGTDVTGNVDLGNSADGISIEGTNNIIGGTTTGAGNVISGNNQNGVRISQVGSTGNQVLGNYIGTNAAGTADLGNIRNGVEIQYAPNNIIGGTAAGARNVISGNNLYGIWIAGNTATGTQVLGNYIGTNASGTAAIGNSLRGITVSAPDNTIGGTAAGAGNVISGNVEGIAIQGTEATGNQVKGNYIGTQADGTSALGNASHGVVVRSDAKNNTIGGTTAGAGNTIAFNSGDGVFVDNNFGTVNNNGILSNSIFSNSGLGIDLGTDGVTANDVGDGDTGANNFQNYPLLTAATANGVNTAVTGTFNSTPNTTFRLEFFSNTALDPSGNGEGQTFLGFSDVTTDASGNASFTATLAAVTSGSFISATAIGSSNNTSEFSAGVAVTALVSIQALDAIATETTPASDFGAYRISRSSTSGNLTVNLVIDTSSSASSSDYTLSGGGLSAVIPDGQSFVDVTLIPTDDTLPEVDETLRLNLVAGSGYTIDAVNNNATVTIAANDAIQYAISTPVATVAEGNSGIQTITFTVTRSGGIGVASTVDYAIGGTATSGTDYNNILVSGGETALSGTINFAAGDATKTITLDVLGDTTFELNENISVTLSNPNLTAAPASSTISTAIAQVTVVNDDNQPTISINDVSVTEGNSDTTLATFTISLSAASGLPVTVNYATADGTATTVDGDYNAIAPTPITFAPGETSKVINVAVKGDNKFEANETFNVNLTGATNATIAKGTGVGTINNDDAILIPSISISDVTLNEGNSGTKLANFTVSLSNPSAQEIAVNYATANGSAIALGDYTNNAGTLTFAPGVTSQIITVPIVGDNVDEANETFLVNLSNAVNAKIADPQAVGTILDDDTAGFTISPISSNTTEAGGTATFSVKLNSQPTANVTLGLSSSDTTEGKVSTPSLTFTPNNWNQAQTVTVTGVDDAEVDGNIAYKIITAAAVSADLNYNGLNPDDVAVTNLNNDTEVFNIINGTNLSETLIGTAQRDRIYGFGGHDIIAGGLNNDQIYGGEGNDILFGDIQNSLTGGDDLIYGGIGNDRIYGGAGNDDLYGKTGDDQIWGDAGNDRLWGGLGNDIFTGGQGRDTFVFARGAGTDTSRDFEMGQDYIGLTGGLSFAQLSITQRSSHTWITDNANGQTLAILIGVNASTLITNAAATFTIV